MIAHISFPSLFLIDIAQEENLREQHLNKQEQELHFAITHISKRLANDLQHSILDATKIQNCHSRMSQQFQNRMRIPEFSK
jgi:hypothetical protein